MRCSSPSPPRLTVRLRLGEGRDQSSPGRLLATSPDGTTVYVLVREPNRLSIAVVATAPGRLRTRIPLPAGLDGGPWSWGRAAERCTSSRTAREGAGTREGGASRARSCSSLILAPDASGRASSSDRSRAATGSCTPPPSRRTSGRSTSATTAPIRRAPTGLRCPSSGAVAARHNPRPAVRRLAAKLNTRLVGNHLMDFAVTNREDAVAAVGSCVYRPGVALLDLRTGTSRVSTREPEICAECIVFAGDACSSGATPARLRSPTREDPDRRRGLWRDRRIAADAGGSRRPACARLSAASLSNEENPLERARRPRARRPHRHVAAGVRASRRGRLNRRAPQARVSSAGWTAAGWEPAPASAAGSPRLISR